MRFNSGNGAPLGDRRFGALTFAPIGLRRILLCAVLFQSGGFVEISSAGAPSTPSPPPFRLRVSPLDIAVIRSISPLGNLNPRGGHIFPTDHIYFDYGRQPGLPVSAPAEGIVQSIRTQSGDDFKVEVKVNGRASYYVAHLFVDKGIKVGGLAKAGETLGTTSGRGSLDLGCIDTEVTLAGFANPKRYPTPTLHAGSPLKYYDEPLRSRLYEKVQAAFRDKDGKIDFDVPEKLIGNWFLEGLSVGDSARGERAIWAKQMAFVPDARRPGVIVISVGGTVAPAGIYQADDGSPDPANVASASGKIFYKVSWREEKRTNHGIFLVQMLAADRVKVQFFSEAKEDEAQFTSMASVYRR